MTEVRLRPMTAAEYTPWREREMAGYAEDLVRNGRCGADVAPRRARESFERLLPDGPETKDHTIFVAEDPGTGERVGTLWLGPGEDPTQAWVWSIEVDEPHRGRGFGKALMGAFEDEARGRGFVSVGLNVFGDNEVARRMYESLGYREIARQMTKPLSGEGRGPSGGGT